jgi:4'-phosphopantetheinyl transferase
MHSLLQLGHDEIHLWLSFFDGIRDERLLSRYRDLLTEEELAQQRRFYFARDRHRYLVTRAMVRTILSRYAAVPPETWQFAWNAYGRPEIANVGQNCASLSFNISHTNSLIVLGVAARRVIGVDVESVVDRDVSLEIASHYFSLGEIAALAGTSVSQRKERFFEYWTFKEAYIKARGMGLSLPLDKFTFQFPGDGCVGLTIDPELEDDPAHWQLWQYRPAPEYLVAVCVSRAGVPARLTTIRTIAPLAEEELLVLKPTRTSS